MRTGNRFLVLGCIAAILAAFIGCAPAPQAPAGDSVYDKIDAWVQAGMSASGVPGLSLAIVKGADIVYMKGYGTADSTGRAVTPQTPFMLASVSKSITALCVLQLVEAGTVSLDAPATTYLPQFKTLGGSVSGTITVRQLLNQTSGLSNYSGNLLNHEDGVKPLDSLVGELAGMKLASPPGSAFYYSNANYVVLAAIVEHVSGMLYADYVNGHVFQPLGMTSSGVEATGKLKESMAAGHQPWFGVQLPAPPYSPVACLNNISTAEDMSHYLLALMNGGTFGGVSVLKPESVAEMQKPAAVMKPGVSYAMGLEVDTTRSYAVIRHPGDARDFNANIAILPGDKWSIIVLQNTNWLGMEGETGAIIAGIEDILEGGTPAAKFINPGTIRILFDIIYIVSLFFLLRAILRLGIFKRKIALDSKNKLRRRLIPVIMNNLTVPIGILLFVPMAFSANWAIGLQNAPDFSLMMIAISALLLALGASKIVIIVRTSARRTRDTAETV